MSSHSLWDLLDAEFDHLLVDMKPFVLKLSNKTERQCCALWVKKLCEPPGDMRAAVWRPERNAYARLLLDMLRYGRLEGPFSSKPPAGSLQPLPADQKRDGPAWDEDLDRLPTWAAGELESPQLSQGLSRDARSHLAFSDSCQEHRRKWKISQDRSSQSTNAMHRSTEDDPTTISDLSGRKPVNMDESDFENRLNSWNLGIENPRYLREKPIPLSPIVPRKGSRKMDPLLPDAEAFHTKYQKEMGLKMKAMEEQFQTEQVAMQLKHETHVQEILDGKKSELEELNAVHQNEQKEAADAVRKLGKKVDVLVQESHVVRETKDKQIEELMKMMGQSGKNLKNDYEKKLNEAIASLEQERLELQKHHTGSIQALLDETNMRLAHMEAEHKAHALLTGNVKKELEARVEQLKADGEAQVKQKSRLEQENAELTHRNQALSRELQDVKGWFAAAQSDTEQLSQEHAHSVKQLQARLEGTINFLKQEHAVAAAKAAAFREDLEMKVNILKQQLEEVEHQGQLQLKESEAIFREEKFQLEHLYETKLKSAQGKLEQEKEGCQKSITALETALRDKEEQLRKVREMQRVQARQADATLEQLRKEVELNTEKVLIEMKQQMQRVEEDLRRAKAVRERQAEEFSHQQQALQQQHEQQLRDVRLHCEEEKSRLLEQHATHMESVARTHAATLEQRQRDLQATVAERENQAREWRHKDAETIAQLEETVLKLQEEVEQANCLRKQQLVELGLLREEEKQATLLQHETTCAQIRAEAERTTLDAHKQHAVEIEQASAKSAEELRTMEVDYSAKLSQAAKAIMDLQAQVASIHEEASEKSLDAEKRLHDAVTKMQGDLEALRQEHRSTLQELHGQKDTHSRLSASWEKQLQQIGLKHQEQVTALRQEHEKKLKGLMPADVRKQLEETIASLQSQVNCLQKRASLLQEQLDNQKTL
ncbi:LOW QUALITY PROTEIN: centrosomal protein of 112 kDa-like [Lethenteron reissneri]|uniref:LOW QUALITY PROTEIN: centrosomal protein of 112 kDa-like n=1 Tax=Lethenteron reissneri TaxID=7753 RepID=UPI002AB7E2A6|nr:LOW QUALITY PROTEIN: centrosomal protein of 112 kDa-like [Lethenteron reissneri]